MSALTIAGISGGLLIVFTILFHLEAKRGDRIILNRFRALLDRGVVYLFNRIARNKMYIGSGSFRIILHYYIHNMLNRLLSGAEKFYTYIQTLQQHNRTLVKSVKEMREKTHFEIIAEHKAMNMLSDEDRQKLKEQAIEGK